MSDVAVVADKFTIKVCEYKKKGTETPVYALIRAYSV